LGQDGSVGGVGVRRPARKVFFRGTRQQRALPPRLVRTVPPQFQRGGQARAVPSLQHWPPWDGERDHRGEGRQEEEAGEHARRSGANFWPRERGRGGHRRSGPFAPAKKQTGSMVVPSAGGGRCAGGRNVWDRPRVRKKLDVSGEKKDLWLSEKFQLAGSLPRRTVATATPPFAPAFLKLGNGVLAAVTAGGVADPAGLPPRPSGAEDEVSRGGGGAGLKNERKRETTCALGGPSLFNSQAYVHTHTHNTHTHNTHTHNTHTQAAAAPS
jgi:hypothetical protein